MKRRVSLKKIARELNRRSATVLEAANDFERKAIMEAAEERKAVETKKAGKE
jgi:Mn-dependent DtxR family transcriptional regulator